MDTGKAVFITGPMFCGKTEELIRIAHRYKIADKNTLILKKRGENRYGENVIVTHNNRAIKAKEINSFTEVFPVISNMATYREINAVFIDEVQFIKDITKDNINHVTKLGINLYMSGLTLDSFQLPFSEIIGFLPYVDIVQLESVCNFCGRFNAKYTFRNFKENTEQIFVGGIDSYKAICASCLNKEKINEQKNNNS